MQPRWASRYTILLSEFLLHFKEHCKLHNLQLHYIFAEVKTVQCKNSVTHVTWRDGITMIFGYFICITYGVHGVAEPQGTAGSSMARSEIEWLDFSFVG